MKKIFVKFLLLPFIALLCMACEEDQPTLTIVVDDTLVGEQINLDFIQIDNSKEGKGFKTLEAKDDGATASFLLEGFEVGTYGVRFKGANIVLPLDKFDESIIVSGSLQDFKEYTYTVEGSSSSNQFKDFVSNIRTLGDRGALIKMAKELVLKPEISPVTKITVASQLLRNPTYKAELFAVNKEAKSKYPETKVVKQFNALVQDIAVQFGIGDAAPEITMPSPDGKVMSLSQLKGKVVLLDFWASWCRPCRANNPHIVSLHKKYQELGFEVFSVSLDKDKSRWVQAIKQDGLYWPYHVSDLQFWKSAAARKYKVSSIPATFLVDRDGNLATMNVRSPQQIEAKIKELL